MKQNGIFSDLVCDYDFEKNVNGEDTYSEQMIGKIKVEYLKIRSAEYEKILNKRSGDYVSIHFEDICTLSIEEEDELISVLACEMRKFSVKDAPSVLVIGIGNSDFVADSLGKRSVKKLAVKENTGIYSASVDISERTGIESADFVVGISSVAGPDMVVLIDSVVTKSEDRLSRTIQLSDSGISPGSGLGAVKKTINRYTVGLPVLTIGVPTVIDSHSMILNYFEKFDFERPETPFAKKLFLTPHSIDFMVERFAYVIARAIEKAFS